jgi:AAA domain
VTDATQKAYAFGSFANPDETGWGLPRDRIFTDPEAAAAFCQQEDQPGRSVYECPNEIKPGMTRAKANVHEVQYLYVDTDSKDISESLTTVDQRLGALEYPPTRVNDSGHGRHIIYKLAIPVDTADAESMALVERTQKRMLVVFCGDPQVAHPAAYIRKVGTHNSKNGEWLEVKTLQERAVEYHLEDLASWLDDQPPVCMPKPKSNGSGNGASPNDPFAQHAAENGWKEPIDVEARLAAMTHQGAGNTAVHATELDCINSLVVRGVPPKEAVQKVLDAVMAKYPQWNARREERDLREMALSFLKKNPELSEKFGWDGDGVPRANAKDNIKALEAFFPEYTFPDPAKLGRREWLYGEHYMRKAVTSTSAAGGTAKTTLAIVEALAMASGRPLLGELVEKPLRVCFWSGEEHSRELDFRIAAAMQHYGITEEELGGRLYIATGFHSKINLLRVGSKGGIETDTVAVKNLLAAIKHRKFDVVILDPLIAIHAIPENENTAIATLIGILSDIAQEANCAIEAPSHTRKANGTVELTRDDARGGSAMVDRFRSLRLLRPMSAKEAGECGIDPMFRSRYVQMTGGKQNYTGPKQAKWLELKIVTLPEGEPVAVVDQWEFGRQGDGGITDADCEWARGYVLQKTAAVNPKRRDYFGPAVAERLNLNIHLEADADRVNNSIKAWLRAGVLTEKPEGPGDKMVLRPGSQKSVKRKPS